MTLCIEFTIIISNEILYKKDSTIEDSLVKLFESTQYAVNYLKGMVQRKTGMNYEQYLTHLTDLGHLLR